MSSNLNSISNGDKQNEENKSTQSESTSNIISSSSSNSSSSKVFSGLTFYISDNLLLNEARKENKKRGIPKPKRPASAFVFFVENERENIVKEFKNNGIELFFADISKELTKKWKQLTDEQKKPYNDMNNKDQIRYEEEMKIFKQPPPKQPDSSDEDDDDDDELNMSSLLIKYGGIVLSSITQSVTHIVTNEMESTRKKMALELGVPIVVEKWVKKSLQSGSLSKKYIIYGKHSEDEQKDGDEEEEEGEGEEVDEDPYEEDEDYDYQCGSQKQSIKPPLPKISNPLVKELIKSFPESIPTWDDYAWNTAGCRITVYIESNGLKQNKKHVESKVDNELKITDVAKIVGDYASDIPKYVVVLEILGSEDSDWGGSPTYLNALRVCVFGTGAKKRYLNRNINTIIELSDNEKRVHLVPRDWDKESYSGYDPYVWARCDKIFLRGIGEIPFERTIEWFQNNGVEIQKKYRGVYKDFESMFGNVNRITSQKFKKEYKSLLKKKEKVLQINKYDLSRALLKQYKDNMFNNQEDIQKYFSSKFKKLNPVKLLQLDDFYAGDSNRLCDGFGGRKCDCDRHPPFNPTFHLIAQAIIDGSDDVFKSEEGIEIMKCANCHWDYWPFQPHK